MTKTNDEELAEFKSWREDEFLHCMINGLLGQIESSGCRPEFFGDPKRRMMFEFFRKINAAGVGIAELKTSDLVQLLADEGLWGMITLKDLDHWIGWNSKPEMADPTKIADALRQLHEAGV